ncbi:ABC transporter permease subunit [Tumebacillus sp. DT12]|uniref:ABC transporter permease subunit n=1 Tax=Tumebacillus lacus TaxID=2995335 RepID=A0ABT3X7R7_9BACL|nr:ABC transporter permease subunit [Tumebacillus lacus]MCX7572033.1 ABC transporter permease subunit [Tumebacillus lacus]
MTQTWNRSLILGVGGTLVLLFVILFGPLLAPYTMEHFGLFQTITMPDGTPKMASAPFPPSKDYPLGTDLTGRDILSILLLGARVTVTFAVVVALVRIVFGFPLGYLCAMFPRTVGWANEKLSTAFTTVPAVMFVALLAGIFNLSDALTPMQNIVMLALLTALVGLFPSANVLHKKMETLMQSPFLEGQRAIGSGRWRILRKHLLPHLSSYTLVLFVSEIAQVLWLVTQLGFLYIFIGGAIFNEAGPPSMRYAQEWAGNMATQIRAIRTSTMVVLYPVLAMSFAILSFNLLAEGIRQRNDARWGIR